MHATFFGAKLPNQDVENLVLYYIDSFAVPGRHGVRFEIAPRPPASPDGAEYPYGYRYELAPRRGGFAHWRETRRLARFDWAELGSFSGEKKLAQVWLALARGHVQIADPVRAPDTPFSVRVTIRPPLSRTPVVGGLVKGIFDGVVCAFQAHTDAPTVPDVTARISTTVPADPAEIQTLLLKQRRAVLGIVPRLVYAYRAGVKWDPEDDLCLAGELLTGEATGSTWALKGEIYELQPS